MTIDVSLKDLEMYLDLDEVVLSSADISVIGPAPAGARETWREPAEAGPIADPLIGMIVADRYRILSTLGRGGMGIVYKVEHTRIGKLLAMKVLAGELSRNPEVVRRFKREALTVSRLSCPNTVQVFDFGVSDGLTYLVMELVNGVTLGRLLRAEGPMPPSLLGKIMIQVCSSLAEAHRKGIVHRDIKPENIMLVAAEDGVRVPKVLDFGLAKLREAEGLNEITSQGTVLGTPCYMAPEQIRGEEVDARADIYSLGALMYRLLTGQHVFGGASPMTTLERHLREIPIPPAERAPELGIPIGMNRLVMRALRKDPAHRFQQVEEIQALLIGELRAAGSSSVERLLDAGRQRPARPAETIATRDEVDAYERKLRRKRYGAVVLGAAMVAASAGAGASALLPREARIPFVEVEPNNTAAEATPLRLGQVMTGDLGKRLDPSHGDRDFYAFDLPASSSGERASLALRVTALPDLPMCAMLYRPGIASAVGQYCVGRPGRDLVIPALRLSPGRYILAILQDMDAYGGAQPFVHENISDAYTIVAEPATPAPGVEIEPNDDIASATPLELDRPATAAIGWARDQDVFCVPEAMKGRIQWQVRAGFRESGVIEAVPLRDREEGVPVRIHPEARANKPTAADALSPWQSASMAAIAGAPRCLRIRLVADPWSQSSLVPHGGSEPYLVEAKSVP